ncbi:hypothetical protein HNR60_001725 [Rhodopseudomonas rhenobacensis]|uniref:Uncharacterized protein n=1 Tax=Rhodopseudomonas rhenobacensis TaxID=87461 RepID=A0A7W7Z2V5_9BRAD|nr:hypothetical protein [Rhodopseudomonas rhenobacensis]MBB5046976.1 hypothetical protein [Rhodopseudomonas rhenobacensis]
MEAVTHFMQGVFTVIGIVALITFGRAYIRSCEASKDASAKTHDYTRRYWSHDYTFDPIENGMRGRMSGWGSGIRDGDYIILACGNGHTRYRVQKIRYQSDPSDMWFADVVFSPRPRKVAGGYTGNSGALRPLRPPAAARSRRRRRWSKSGLRIQEAVMPAIYKTFEVVFSRSEIQEILTERARAILGSKITGPRAVVLNRVEDVEGGATVKITIDSVKNRPPC